jgi:DNA-binding ferritin-like protein (Dps family)
MQTLEDAIVKELKENYEGVVKELIKKMYEAVSGDRDLILTYLGDELMFFMMDNYSGKSLQERLIRRGLAYVDWDEITEQVLDLFEEVI